MPRWAVGFVAIAVPALFWLFHWLNWPYWWIGVALLPLVFVRGSAQFPYRFLGLTAALLGAASLIAKSEVPLKYYPVLVNAVALSIFAWSLFRPPPIVERIARLRDRAFPEAAVPYVRGVTKAWCIFFVVNGTIAFLTAIAADPMIWAIYNGIVAYALIGLMFIGERLVRRHVMARHHEP